MSHIVILRVVLSHYKRDVYYHCNIREARTTARMTHVHLAWCQYQRTLVQNITLKQPHIYHIFQENYIYYSTGAPVQFITSFTRK